MQDRAFLRQKTTACVVAGAAEAVGFAQEASPCRVWGLPAGRLPSLCCGRLHCHAGSKAVCYASYVPSPKFWHRSHLRISSLTSSWCLVPGACLLAYLPVCVWCIFLSLFLCAACCRAGTLMVIVCEPGETHELREELNSPNRDKKKDAVKKVSERDQEHT